MAGSVTSRILRLSFERRRRGWSQAQVGVLVRDAGGLHRRIKQTDISAMERGRLVPTDRELAAFARLFDVSPPSVLLQPVVPVDGTPRTTVEVDPPLRPHLRANPHAPVEASTTEHLRVSTVSVDANARVKESAEGR